MEGILKQQCINDEALYVWQKKYFKLDVNSLKFDIFGLQDAERKTPTFSIPLNSLKYAKEWSFSSAMGGYGFDLVWFSGNDWSFLVENEKDCQEWVKWINEGIALSNGSKKPASISKEVLETINSHKEFLSSLNSESYQEEYSSLLNKTKQELSSPITLMNNPQEETKTAAKYENRDNVPVHRRTSNIIHEITQDNPFQGLRSPSISMKNRYDQTNDTEEGEEFKQSSHHHNNTTLVDQSISPIPNKGSNADSESEHSAPLSIHQYESSTLPPLPPSSNNDHFPSRRASSSNTGDRGTVNFEENNTNNPARRTSTINKPDETQATTSSSTRRASTVNNNNHQLHQEETTNSTTTRRTSVAMENSNQNSTNNNQTSSRRASVATPNQETTSPTRRRSTVSTPQETTRRSSTVSHPQEEQGSTRRSSVSNNTVQEHPRRSSVTNTPTQQENSTSRRASVTPATASPEGVANRRTSVSAAPNNISPKRSSIANTQERRTSVTNSQEKSNNSPSRRSSVANTPDSTTRRSTVSQGNTGNSNRRSSATGGSPDKKEGTRQRSPSKRVSVVSKENVDQDSMTANDRSLHMTSLNNTTTVPNDLSRIFPSADQYDNTTRYLNNNNLNNTSDPLSPHRINSQSYQPFAHPPPPPHSYNQPQQHYQQQQQELPLYSSYPSSSTFVTSAMKDQYLSNMKNIFQETKNSLYLTENELQDCRMNNNNITTNLK
jgi:hypothetical protein